jgi:hypothetical protein
MQSEQHFSRRQRAFYHSRKGFFVSSENVVGELAPFGPTRSLRPCSKMILIFWKYTYLRYIIYRVCILISINSFKIATLLKFPQLLWKFAWNICSKRFSHIFFEQALIIFFSYEHKLSNAKGLCVPII